DLPLVEQLEQSGELRARLDAAIAELSQEEALKRLNDTAAPVAPIHTRAGMLADEHLRERGTVFDGPDGGPWLAPPVKDPHRPPPPRPPTLPREVDEHHGKGWL